MLNVGGRDRAGVDEERVAERFGRVRRRWTWSDGQTQSQRRWKELTQMLFNSLVFVLFFTIVYGFYRVLPFRGQNVLLLIASWFFYGYWDWRFLSLLILTTTVDWAVGLALDDPARRHRRLLISISIVVNLGILCTFKYLGFFVQEANHLLQQLGVQHALPTVKLLLPVGLSFYTFQSMAYTIDVYRGEVRATRSFFQFALFVAFFPQLVAGPIERSGHLIPQLTNPRKIDRRQLDHGTHLILWGYFKKIFVADNLAIIVSQVFESPVRPNGFLVLVAAYAFSWQIYCDFSGYTDIARGVAKWMGFELSLNFRLPFFASSPQDLWRRWHLSLSQWLRDYLYIPLGGNRRGPVRTQFNLLATMLLGGLWHGANWTFIVWGAYHGLALAIQRMVPDLKPGRLGRAAAIVLTFHFTCLGFLIFRAHSMGHVLELLSAMATSLRPTLENLEVARQLVAVVAVLFVIELAQYLRDDLDLLVHIPRPIQAGLSAALFLCIVMLGASYGRQFIYFQF